MMERIEVVCTFMPFVFIIGMFHHIIINHYDILIFITLTFFPL